MQKQKVIKKSGQSQDFAPAKVKKIIDVAGSGFSLDSSKVVEKLPDFFKDGMTTSELFSALIMNTLALTSVDEPDWKNVAGRLKLFELYRKIRSLRGTPKNASPYNYPEFLDYAVANGIYTPELKSKYTAEEINIAASFIKPEFDLVYDYAGINLLIKRYLCEYNDSIVELPQEMFLTIALLI